MTDKEKTTIEELFQAISNMSREEQNSLLMYVRGIVDGRKLIQPQQQKGG